MSHKLIMTPELRKHAGLAVLFCRAGAERIYMGERMSVAGPHSSIGVLPYLVAEHDQPLVGDRMEYAKLDDMARTSPRTYQGRISLAYGISPPSTLIYQVPSYPSMQRERIPFLFARWLDAFNNGWRFRRRGEGGFFELDSTQLKLGARRPHDGDAKVLMFPGTMLGS